MRVLLVTEGPFDVELLEWICEPEIRQQKIKPIAAGGRSAAQALASTLLLRGESVVLAIDADTVSPEGVEEQRMFLEFELNRRRGRAHFHVELFIPEIETILFAEPEILATALRIPVEDVKVPESEVRPGEVLKRLAGGRKLTVMDRLKTLDAQPFRAHPHIAKILAYLESL